MKSAVFLDRDGTIIEDVGYLSSVDDIRLLPGAANAIRMLNHMSVPVVIVSNQSGVGRGYFSEHTRQDVEAAFNQMLADADCQISGAFYCPHGPIEGCACRKPRPGMLYTASELLDIDLKTSYMIGDKVSDVEAGRRAGCKTGLVLSGNGRRSYAALTASKDVRPDYVAASLMGMTGWIVRQLALRRPLQYASAVRRR